MRVILCQ